ncbi:phage prohead assembly (scaffolding) protein [Yersinia phage phiR1-RT]|uniref:Phage prohead assembly (Scaffolding) protein n=1 Tax=Yersinia phage phiR1-RT TaxID=1206558 RepID=I7LH86_BPPR1|nr:head scaffolding protein [Yersinia phage phiR1-RT]CCI88749.1 phage prohead assembly (scaffolding) protein [Yersinia phage phiR1-RT]
MHIKEQLIKEAQTLMVEASVELGSVFESVQLSDEVKTNFSTVFETLVKKNAAALAEKHINEIADKAEEEVEKAEEEADKKAEKKITESASRFLDHIAKEWLAENKLAVDRGIKSDLFESMFSGLKELFVEHNVVVPEESVDVVAEMEEELAEQTAETGRLFEELGKRNAYINYIQREVAITEATRNLVESHKEQVVELLEGVEYSEGFAGKLNSIVSMVSASKSTQVNEAINTTEDIDATALNFISEAVEDTANPTTQKSTMMNLYTRAASSKA